MYFDPNILKDFFKFAFFHLNLWYLCTNVYAQMKGQFLNMIAVHLRKNEKYNLSFPTRHCEADINWRTRKRWKNVHNQHTVLYQKWNFSTSQCLDNTDFLKMHTVFVSKKII